MIFIFPIWWWDAPGIFKNFFDSNFTPNFAYKYVNGKSVWLLTWKKVDIIATSWGPSWLYNIVLPIRFLWSLNRIGFCGMKLRIFKVIGNADTKKFQFDNVKKFLENFKI
jgi:putative NADPH-quinone reductase